jgi:outer membrane protein assembly factor BamE (lipoprotein component of BamABCDE complex)
MQNQTHRVLIALSFGLMSGLGVTRAALAETILIDDQVQVRESTVDKPKRGITMTQVEAKFGTPVTKHDAVGQPPITRWDYPGFSVFFEHDRVIDSVVTSG